MNSNKWAVPTDLSIERRNDDIFDKKLNSVVNSKGDVLDPDEYRKIRKEKFINDELGSAVSPKELVDIINERKGYKKLPYNRDLAVSLFGRDDFINDPRFKELSNDDKGKFLNRLYDARHSRDDSRDKYGSTWDDVIDTLLSFRNSTINKPEKYKTGTTRLDLADLLDSIINRRSE